MAIVTWNPADTGPNIAFSNVNLTLTTTGGSFESCRATASFASPLKIYMEHKVTGGTLADVLVGVGSNAAGLNGQFTGQGTNSIGYQLSTGQVLRGGSVQSTIQTGAINDVICVAWIPDVGISLIWVRTNGGNWNNSGAANPATGVGGIPMGGVGGVGGGPFPMATGAGSSVLTSNFGATAFAQAVPSGFGSPNNPTPPSSGSNFFFAA